MRKETCCKGNPFITQLFNLLIYDRVQEIKKKSDSVDIFL